MWWGLFAVPLLVVLATSVNTATAAAAAEVVCERGVNFPGGDLGGQPGAASDAAECRRLCNENKDCVLFTFHEAGCSYHGETCTLFGDPSSEGRGCCYLKASEVPGRAPACNNCTCSAIVRKPPSGFRPAHKPASTPRNVLYLLVDDLRPEIEPYVHDNDTSKVLKSPNMKRLADTGTVFDHAYCQISVCSPSRMSFLTGRRPGTSGIFNFIDHFRQADCGKNSYNMEWREGGKTMRNVAFRASDCGWNSDVLCGGSGQCCTLCSEDQRCGAWTWRKSSQSCELFDLASTQKPTLVPSRSNGTVSGLAGGFGTHASWITMPEYFKEHGYRKRDLQRYCTVESQEKARLTETTSHAPIAALFPTNGGGNSRALCGKDLSHRRGRVVVLEPGLERAWDATKPRSSVLVGRTLHARG